MKLYQKTLMLLCTLGLVLPLMAVRAGAVESYVVDGIFCYEDSNGKNKAISSAKGYVSFKGNNNIGCGGIIEDGVLTLDLYDSLEDGMYTVTVYLDSEGLGYSGELDASRTDGIWEIGEKTIDGKIVFPLKIDFSFLVYDAQTQKPIENVAWKLQKDGTLLDSGTTNTLGHDYAQESVSTQHGFWQGQYLLVLQKEGYQDALYEFSPVIDGEDVFRSEPCIDFSSLRMVPEGVIAQPTPKKLSFSNGVLYWTPAFVNNVGADSDSSTRFCRIDLKNLESGKTYQWTMSCSNKIVNSFDIFSEQADLPGGNYRAQITALAQPYYETIDSEPAYLVFYYNKPNGYLPEVTAPNWKEGSIPTLTWEYDSELLSSVKEFHVIPRVAVTEDGQYCDFVHEFRDDWEGSFTVAPSPDGVYVLPQLEQAMKAYGEGWYSFDVLAVSGADEWENSYWTSCTKPFHYIPDPTDPIKNGTMVDSYQPGFTVHWSLDNKTRRLTITKITVYAVVPDVVGKLWLVTYDKNGRAIKIQNIHEYESSDLSRADSARLFWLDYTFAPISLPADIISAVSQ